MVPFLIHVMGEATPRVVVYDSEEIVRREAALLSIRPRCYTIVRGDSPAADAPLHAD